MKLLSVLVLMVLVHGGEGGWNETSAKALMGWRSWHGLVPTRSGAPRGVVDPTAGAVLLRRAQQHFEEACFPAPRDWGFPDADAPEALTGLVGLLLVLSGTEGARVGVIDAAESGAGSSSFRSDPGSVAALAFLSAERGLLPQRLPQS